MTKRLKNMEIMLGVGAAFIFLAGLGLLTTNFIEQNILRVVSMVVIAVILLLLSEVSNRNLKLKGASIFTYVLGLISIFFVLIGIGRYNLISEKFSFIGDLNYLYISSIFLLIGALLVISKYKYKKNSLLYLGYISFIATIFFMLTQIDTKMYLPIIITDLIFLSLNLIKTKKSFRPYAIISTFVYSALSAFVIFSNDIYLIGTSMIINLVSLLYISKTTKNLSYKFITLGVILFNLILAIFYTFVSFNSTVALVINTCIICLLDMIIGFGKFINNKTARWIYKSILNFILMTILLSSFNKDMSILVLPIFIVGSSLVESFIIKSDNEEKYFFPPKVILSITLLIKLLTDISYKLEFTTILLIINVISLMFYVLSKDNIIRKEYLGMIMISFLILAISGGVFNLSTYIISLAIVALDYFALESMNDKKKNDPVGKIFYSFMIVYFLLSTVRLDYGYIKYAILSTILLILLLFVYKKKDTFKIGITLPALLLSLIGFIAGIDAPEWLIITINHVLVLVSIILFSNLIFKNDKSKEVFMCVAFSVALLVLVGNSLEILALVGLIESLMILLYDLRDGYRNSYFYVGVIFTIIFGLDLLSNFDLPSIVYLLIVGVVIIGAVIYMIIRYKKKDYENDLKALEEKRNPKYKTNYCPECGEKIADNATYCYKCGKKVH